MWSTLGEIVFLGQIRNSGIESGLDRTFEVIDHVGVDKSHFKVVEI